MSAAEGQSKRVSERRQGRPIAVREVSDTRSGGEGRRRTWTRSRKASTTVRRRPSVGPAGKRQRDDRNQS